MEPKYEIRYSDGKVDEIVAEDIDMVHLERMNDGYFWLGIVFKDGSRIVANLLSKGKIELTAEKED